MRLIKRLFLWFQIYALDIHIHDMQVMLESIANHEIRKTVIANIALAKSERYEVRSAYLETFNAGSSQPQAILN